MDRERAGGDDTKKITGMIGTIIAENGGSGGELSITATPKTVSGRNTMAKGRDGNVEAGFKRIL